MDLYPYQVQGAQFLASKGRALLADEMGLGKSAQAIAACDAVCGVGDNVEVVCPASVVENWIREIERFKKGRWTYGVMSYDRAARMVAAGKMPSSIRVLILDEAHYLKNHKAKRTKAIFGDKCDGSSGLVSRAKHVFCLTGTPTPNNPSELWPILRAVMPQAIAMQIQGLQNFKPDDFVDLSLSNMHSRPMAYWPFVQRYCVTRDNGFGIQIVKGKNLPELKARIAPWVLRRKKDEVLKDLPPIRFDELPLKGDLGTWQANIALHPEAALAVKTLEEKGVAGLREIAPHVAQLRRVTGLAKVGPAAEWISDWFENGGVKLVVFAHHRDVIDALCKSAKPEWRACALTGSDSVETRQFIVDDFQRASGSKLFIGQIQAAGTGITLTAASDLLFVESSWVPAENEQAAMRIHRIGQKNACMVRFATLAGSIDENIQRAVMRKTADIAKLFN